MFSFRSIFKSVNNRQEQSLKKWFLVKNHYSSSPVATKKSTSGNSSRIISVEPDVQKRMLNVRWNDGSKSVFPFVWLLDSAPFDVSRMSQCGYTCAHNRLLALNELPVQPELDNLTINDDGQSISVQWPPYHEAVFGSDWLKERAFRSTPQSMAAQHQTVVTWGRADMQIKMPRINAADFMQGNILACREKLLDFAKYGILMISNFGHNVNPLEVLGYNYDEIKQNVVRCLTHGFQGLHTGGSDDEAAPPALGVLIIKNGNMADTEATVQLVDGFRVAEQLEETHPSIFTYLCNTPIEYCNEYNSGGNKKPQNRPVFSLSPTGSIQRIVFNNALRASKCSLPPDEAEYFYRALKTFNSYCYQSRNLLNIRVNEGDVILVANHRILHGNTAYSYSGEDNWIDEVFVDDEPLKKILKYLKGL